MQLKQLADRYIPKPLNAEFFYKDGNTGDIAKKVFQVYEARKDQVKDLAPHLRGRTLTETCYNIWKLIKENIAYRVDPRGRQWVRRPARLWFDKIGDCKSYSVFAASCLYHLGIKGTFRFVRFKDHGAPTHVYVVVMNNGREIIIDAVMPGFNQEKPYQQKWDYNMTRISELAGLPRQKANGQIAGGLSTAINKGARRKTLDAALPGLAILSLYQWIPAGDKTFAKEVHQQFLTKDDLLSNLPAVIKQKRLTSFQSFWDFGDWADLRVENDVFPRVRMLLTNQLGMDPMDWWRKVLSQPVSNMAGIGNTPAPGGGFNFGTTLSNMATNALNPTALITGFLSSITGAIGKLFGGSDIKWLRGDPSVWAPAASDWNGTGIAPLALIPVSNPGGQQLPVTYYPPNTPQPQPPSPMPTGPGSGNVQQPGGGSGNVQQPGGYTPPEDKKDNTGIYIAVAVAVLLLLKK